jgi:hypothetical protein
MATNKKATSKPAPEKATRKPLAVDPREDPAVVEAARKAALVDGAQTKVLNDASFKRRETKEERAAHEMVTVIVPRAYKFTAAGHVLIDYPQGIYEMPRSHAEDSFSVGMGVEVQE